jgi:hypothetical protein
MIKSYVRPNYVIIYAFLFISLIIGLLLGRRVKNIKEYIVGKRNFTILTLVIAYLATNIASNNLIDIDENGAIMAVALLAFSFVFLLSLFIGPNAVYFSNCIIIDDMRNKLYSIQGKFGTIAIAILITQKGGNFFELLMAYLDFTSLLLMVPLFSGMMGLKTHKIDFHLVGVFTIISFFATKFILPENMQHFGLGVHGIVNGLVFFASHIIRNVGVMM